MVRSLIERVKVHISTLERTDGCEGIERLLDRFSNDLLAPSQRKVENMKKYAQFLESYFNLSSDRFMRRFMRGIRHFQDPALLDLAAQFTVELDRVGVNLMTRTMTAIPANPNQDPLQFAEDFIKNHPSSAACSEATSPSSLLSDAAALYGSFLSLDPTVISSFWEVLFEESTVSSNPTEKGLDLDSASPLFGYHRLRGKPIASLTDQEFRLLEEGDRDGYLTYQFDCTRAIEEFRIQLIQLLVDERSPFAVFQRNALDQCCSLLHSQAPQWIKQVHFSCHLFSRMLRTLQIDGLFGRQGIVLLT